MTICTRCRNKFSAREALCEDWRDPERAFGCPHCGTFFLKDMSPEPGAGLLGGLLGGGVGTPAVMLAFHGWRSGDPLVLTLAAIMLLSVAAAGLIMWRSGKRPLQVSPYRARVDAAEL